jgi:ADP-ribose pyrophosphatase YjhB (NUDIX family)
MRKEIKWLQKDTGEEKFGYYDDSEDFSNVPQDKIKSVCAFCACGDKFIIVNNEGRWEPVAGSLERGETDIDALFREVKEESDTKVLKYYPIGYWYTYGDDIYQTRYFCVVEPYGPFLTDPDGGVTEIKFVDFEEAFNTIGGGDTAQFMRDKCEAIIKKGHSNK